MPKNSYDSWAMSFLRSAVKSDTPVEVYFELTSRCNLNCKMCYVHNQDAASVLPKELTTEQWKTIMDEAFSQGMFFATLTGGECLLRKDFRDLYLYLYQKGVHLSVFSNSVLMDESYIDFFSQYPPKTIQVSVYGSNDDFYERVTGVRVFDKVSKNLALLKQRLQNTKLRIVVTPSRYMTEDYETILRFCKEHNYNCANNDLFLYENRDDKNKNDYTLTVDEIIRLEKSRKLLTAPLTPMTDLPAPCGKWTERYGTGCNAGTCRAFISWDGYMSPCVNLTEYRVPVKELGFTEAWKRTVASAKTFQQPGECDACAYKKVCFHCPVNRVSAKRDGHCNPFTCELTVKKCEAGIFEKL